MTELNDAKAKEILEVATARVTAGCAWITLSPEDVIALCQCWLADENVMSMKIPTDYES